MSGFTAVSIPLMPRWLLFLRIAILVLSLAVLIAAAYNVSLFDRYGTTSSPTGFLIFDSIFTMLIFGPMITFEILAYHKFFYRLAFLVLLPLDIIFWLAAWAWAASWATQVDALRGFGYDGYDEFYGSVTAAAVLGAFTWVMVIVATVYFVLACYHEGRSPAADVELNRSKPDEPQSQYA